MRKYCLLDDGVLWRLGGLHAVIRRLAVDIREATLKVEKESACCK